VRDDVDAAVALFAVTCGEGVRERAEALKARGDYLKSHALQALAIECAEAFPRCCTPACGRSGAFRIPPSSPSPTSSRRTTGAFASPSATRRAPTLADQATLWRVLRPEQIGVQLTEGFMMDPEASVSALVFHQPSATSFNAT
jgi:5-methyltetrahydrofolate--homocysteine methyltransferase